MKTWAAFLSIALWASPASAGITHIHLGELQFGDNQRDHIFLLGLQDLKGRTEFPEEVLGRVVGTYWCDDLPRAPETAPVPVPPRAQPISCWDITFDVGNAPGTHQLRVGSNKRLARGEWVIEVFSPNGTRVAAFDDGHLSNEVILAAPAPGQWRVRVAQADSRAPIDLRVRHEPGRQWQPGTPRKLKPDLRPIPPLGANFNAATYLVFGPSLDSCSIDERLGQYSLDGQGPKQCLRFSAGFDNVGKGFFKLQVDPPWSSGDLLEGPIYQIFRLSDGSHSDPVLAGRYVYDVAHAHYHYGAMFHAELLGWDDTLQRAFPLPDTRGTKIGFCSSPGRMADFHLTPDQGGFYQEPRFEIRAQCGPGAVAGPNFSWPPIGATFGLSRGWGDIYGSSNPGNYVDFGGNGPGKYVIRMKADPHDLIDETHENNNFGYALVEVGDGCFEPGCTRPKVTVLERGIGRDPSDPDAQVLNDIAPN